MGKSRGGMAGKNTNSVRLRIGDGKKSAVHVTTMVSKLSPEQVEAALVVRALAAQQLKGAREDAANARRRLVTDKRRDSEHVSRTPKIPHIPANQREDYTDPMSRRADPRRNQKSAPTGNKNSKNVQEENKN